MKIAVIGAKGLPPKQGGIEHYCAEVYPRMAAQGYSVDLFARSSYLGSGPYDEYDYEGVRIISLPCLNLKGVDAFTSSAIGAIAARGTQYDVIHFHALGPALFTALSRLASSSKIVVTCQGLDWQRSKWGNFSSRLILAGEQAAVRYADEIIVVSEALRSYFFKTYGRSTVYIPNGPAGYADCDSVFTHGRSLGLEQKRYLIFLGRLVPEKCPDVLIKAFQSLKPVGWKLVLVGGDSDTSGYKMHLANLAAGNADIVFTGELQAARLAEIVRGAGLFVLPSEVEGLPLAMLEGMLEGIPVIASDIAPHKQLLGMERGILFEVGNVEGCARSLEWAINHPQNMKNMAAKAQEHVKHYYSWDRITRETIKLYKILCKSPTFEAVRI